MLVTIVTIVRLSGPLSAETLGRPLGVRSGKSGVGSNTTESIVASVSVVRVSVIRFGFGGPLGLGGESPNSLADEAGTTAGVGGEGLGFFISGPLADTLGTSGQKLIKNAKNGSFCRVFENLKLAVKQCYQKGQF